MRIKEINLINFRNYSSLSLEFSDNINIIIGNNGEGKTNILESIYVLSLTKSNRYGMENDLIKFGENAFSIKGKVYDHDFLKIMQVINEKNKKKVFINQKEILKIKDYISNFCVISFSPGDQEIMKGSPSIRRNYLNMMISQLYNDYIKYLNEYNYLLKMRNDYLKKLNINNLVDKRYLDIITDKMIENALKIYEYRFMYIDNINKNIESIFYKLTGVHGLKVFFDNFDNILEFDSELIKKRLNEKLEKNYHQELMLGNTLIGPHRDDFKFLLNNMDMKIYSSQGQQRLALIALKIAELHVFKDTIKSYPVLLLDDIFSEIDILKQNKVIKFLNKDVQTIITTTDINSIDEKFIKNAKIFHVKNGKIKTKGRVKYGK